MKKIILALLLPFILFSDSYAQNTYFGFWGGAGASINYNYNVGIAGGLTFLKQGKGRFGMGADLFYQGYAFKYDREAHGMKNGAGNAGVIILNKSSYIFVTPKFIETFGKGGNLEAYLTVGAGFKMSGKETMRKWDRTHGVTAGDYDSTDIDTSPNINSMVLRIGLGLTEYLHMGKKWYFTFTEDFGFIPSSLTKTGGVTDPSRTSYSPNGKLNPFFISLYVGIRHVKNVGYSTPARRGTNLGY